MKRIQIGFLALIAVLAMSFTVADTQGLLKKANFLCVQGVDYSVINTPSGLLRQTIDPCPGFEETCAQLITLAPTDIDCLGGPRFCCATIIDECTTTPNFPVLVEIACKPVQ